MKKKYTELKYKKYIEKCTKREAQKKRKERKTKWINEYPNALKTKIRVRNSKRKRKKLILPSIFSIVENTNETLNFFNIAQNLLENGRKLFFDMSKVKALTLDALLYILSILNYFELRGIGAKVRGNVPQNEKCVTLLIDSGFFKFVNPSKKLNQKINPDILQFKSGTNVDVKIAKKVVDFCLVNLNQNPSVKSKCIYKMLIELMGNTYEHAFENREKTSKWYLFALHDKNDKKVKFAFLDGGLGIPSTIIKNKHEKIIEVVNRLLKDKFSIDSKLIKSALDGNFRTRTKRGWRGKGLPSIYSNLKLDYIEKLTIIANMGHFNEQDSLIDLNVKFNGTLYIWNFV